APALGYVLGNYKWQSCSSVQVPQTRKPKTAGGRSNTRCWQTGAAEFERRTYVSHRASSSNRGHCAIASLLSRGLDGIVASHFPFRTLQPGCTDEHRYAGSLPADEQVPGNTSQNHVELCACGAGSSKRR